MRENFTAICVIFALLLISVGLAAKPPERVEHVDCSVFEFLQLSPEVQRHLRDPDIPERSDFKLRLAITEDWSRNRADVADRFDALVAVCKDKFAEVQAPKD